MQAIINPKASNIWNDQNPFEIQQIENSNIKAIYYDWQEGAPYRTTICQKHFFYNFKTKEIRTI